MSGFLTDLFLALTYGALIAVFIDVIELNHGWTKLYNWLAGIFGWTKKPVPSTPNSTSHEERYFWGWCGICAGLLLFALSVYRLYLS